MLRFIDFDMSDRSWIYYIAVFLVVFSHMIHFMTSATLITILQITFIIGYLLLIINVVIRDGCIHISTLLYRVSIISLLMYVVIPKIW